VVDDAPAKDDGRKGEGTARTFGVVLISDGQLGQGAWRGPGGISRPDAGDRIACRTAQPLFFFPNSSGAGVRLSWPGIKALGVGQW